MKNFDEVDYIQRLSLIKSTGKIDLSPDKDPHFQTVIPQLTSLSIEMKFFKRGLLRSWFARLWKDRGFTILFVGATERSKTQAFNFLNERLNSPIYRVDLSMIMSKYIGETEKELNQLFDQAEQEDLVLVFDEIDALFGRRKEINDFHDRFSNEENNLLLKRLQKHNGVIILTTKSKHKLDRVFYRRIRRVINFPVSQSEEESTDQKK